MAIKASVIKELYRLYLENVPDDAEISIDVTIDERDSVVGANDAAILIEQPQTQSRLLWLKFGSLLIVFYYFSILVMTLLGMNVDILAGLKIAMGLFLVWLLLLVGNMRDQAIILLRLSMFSSFLWVICFSIWFLVRFLVR